MDDKQVEQQLTSRRLEIAEIKLQLQQLLNTINKVTNDINNLETKNPSLVVTGSAESDSFLKGDTIYHKLKHAFAISIGFFNAAPANKQTLNSYTSDVESTSYTGIANNVAGTVYARVVDLNVLRTAYETLRVSYDDLRSKLQNTTLVG